MLYRHCFLFFVQKFPVELSNDRKRIKTERTGTHSALCYCCYFTELSLNCIMTKHKLYWLQVRQLVWTKLSRKLSGRLKRTVLVYTISICWRIPKAFKIFPTSKLWCCPTFLSPDTNRRPLNGCHLVVWQYKTYVYFRPDTISIVSRYKVKSRVATCFGCSCSHHQASFKT